MVKYHRVILLLPSVVNLPLRPPTVRRGAEQPTCWPETMCEMPVSRGFESRYSRFRRTFMRLTATDKTGSGDPRYSWL